MPDPTWRELLVHLACTCASCCAADAACLPFDLLKVRMQLQNELRPAAAARLGSRPRPLPLRC